MNDAVLRGIIIRLVGNSNHGKLASGAAKACAKQSRREIVARNKPLGLQRSRENRK